MFLQFNRTVRLKIKELVYSITFIIESGAAGWLTGYWLTFLTLKSRTRKATTLTTTAMAARIPRSTRIPYIHILE